MWEGRFGGTLSPVKLAYLTSSFPFARLGETFLTPEVRLIAGMCEEVHVIPARPKLVGSPFGDLGAVDVRIPVASAETFRAATTEAFLHPYRATIAFWRIAWPRYPIRAKLKNLALFPKALAVAGYVRKHGIDHVHAHWLTTSSTIAYVVTTMTDVPWSCTAHAHDVYSDNLLPEKAASARFVRVISARNCAAFTRMSKNGTAVRARVVHVGVEVPDDPAPMSTREVVQMLSPARLHPMKGHRVLLEALAYLRDAGACFHCDLAGDGELRDEISQAISKLGLGEWVTMRGTVDHANLLAELRSGKYDVVVLSSVEDPRLKEFFEGIPVALVEAMAAGVACVSTAVGSIPELIDADTGIIVRQQDPRALADALIRMSTDRELRLRVGSAARKRIEEQFDVTKTTQALYDLICAGKASGP
jgi:colanic acid/amylovoran biosynthesis glycosyltransferase